jgi:guanylate kinase
MIFILSGPSGSGKTTLRNLLLKDPGLKKKLVKSVSITTRMKRLREVEGRDYFFVDKETFNLLKKKRKILEWTKYLGYYYGTKKDIVEAALRAKKGILLCLDFKGTQRIKRLYSKETVSIFVLPPSIKELHKRIYGRSCKTGEKELLCRIKIAKKELLNAAYYDYTLRNRNLDQALKRLKTIILNKLK